MSTSVLGATEARRLPRWTARLGQLGFAFFFVKGLAWLLLPAALWLLD